MRRNTIEPAQHTTRVHTRSQREEAHAPDTSSVKKHIRELRALGVPVPENENPGTNEENVNNRGSKVLEVEEADNETLPPDRVAAAIAFALVDRYGEDVGALPDFALATSELDPSKYKHVFENVEEGRRDLRAGSVTSVPDPNRLQT